MLSSLRRTCKVWGGSRVQVGMDLRRTRDDAAGWQLGRVARKNARENAAFAGAGNQEDHAGSGEQRGLVQRDAQRPVVEVACEQAVPASPPWLRIGKEAGRVAILTDTEQDAVENGRRTGAREFGELTVVVGRRLLRRNFAPDAVDSRRGQSQRLHEERPGGTVIAAWIVGRNQALIDPPQMHARPRDACRRGEYGIQAKWCIATGERQVNFAAPFP